VCVGVCVCVRAYVYNSRCFEEHVWGRPPAEATTYSCAPYDDGLRAVYSLLGRRRRCRAIVERYTEREREREKEREKYHTR